MPNNENNNFELPNFNNNNKPQEQPPHSEQKPIIEIPQEYYDKLAQEQAEKARIEAEKIKSSNEAKEAKNLFGKLFVLIIINAAIIFFLINSYLKINEKIIFVIPIYIILMAAFQALKDKKESLQSLAIMIGGMAVAVITFLLSAVDSKQVDLWSYYALASAIIAFVGLLLTNIITKIIADRQNIKALQSVGMILFIVALIGVPYYLYQKDPEKAYRLLFQKKAEVKAETEDEYIIKILNNRYDAEFVCDLDSIKSSVDQKNRKINTRLCYETETLKEKNIPEAELHNRINELEDNRVIVTSIAYSESDTQYIIQDDYMDVVLLRAFENRIAENLTQALSANKVILYLYPEENCSFIGNCADNDDYYKNYERETNPENQFNNSAKLDLSKYVRMKDTDFVNEYKFKYILTVTSTNFNTEDTYQPAINTILSQLDKLGLKNTYGYVINLYNIPLENQFPTKVYEKVGETNSNQTFTGA